MSIITKPVLVCNKCGKDVAYAKANVTILDEEFFLCDECLDKLLSWFSLSDEEKVERVISSPQAVETVLEMAQELKKSEDVFDENGVPKDTKPHKSHAPLSATQFKWDDRYIDQLLTYREQGYDYAKCAKVMGVTVPSITSVLRGIRHAQVGSDKYKWRARLRAMGYVGGRCGQKAPIYYATSRKET